MTPILVILFGFKPTYAVGTDILHGAIFKSFGAIRHRRLGTVHARLTLWMFLGSGPLSLAGVGVATLIKHHYGDSAQTIESYAVGGALVAGGLGFLAKSFIKRGVQSSDAPFILSRARQGARGDHRRRLRLRRRPDVGRQRHVLRARDGARLSADDAEDRRHRHLPRGRAALGRGHRAHDRRQRRLPRDRVAAHGLDSRRADLEPLHREAARRRAARSRSARSSS